MNLQAQVKTLVDNALIEQSQRPKFGRALSVPVNILKSKVDLSKRNRELTNTASYLTNQYLNSYKVISQPVKKQTIRISDRQVDQLGKLNLDSIKNQALSAAELAVNFDANAVKNDPGLQEMKHQHDIDIKKEADRICAEYAYDDGKERSKSAVQQQLDKFVDVINGKSNQFKLASTQRLTQEDTQVLDLKQQYKIRKEQQFTRQVQKYLINKKKEQIKLEQIYSSAANGRAMTARNPKSVCEIDKNWVTENTYRPKSFSTSNFQQPKRKYQPVQKRKRIGVNKLRPQPIAMSSVQSNMIKNRNPDENQQENSLELSISVMNQQNIQINKNFLEQSEKVSLLKSHISQYKSQNSQYRSQSCAVSQKNSLLEPEVQLPEAQSPVRQPTTITTTCKPLEEHRDLLAVRVLRDYAIETNQQLPLRPRTCKPKDLCEEYLKTLRLGQTGTDEFNKMIETLRTQREEKEAQSQKEEETLEENQVEDLEKPFAEIKQHITQSPLPNAVKQRFVRSAIRLSHPGLIDFMQSIQTVEDIEMNKEMKIRAEQEAIRNQKPQAEIDLERQIKEIDEAVLLEDKWPALAACSKLASIDTEREKREMKESLVMKQKMRQGIQQENQFISLTRGIESKLLEAAKSYSRFGDVGKQGSQELKEVIQGIDQKLPEGTHDARGRRFVTKPDVVNIWLPHLQDE